MNFARHFGEGVLEEVNLKLRIEMGGRVKMVFQAENSIHERLHMDKNL